MQGGRTGPPVFRHSIRRIQNALSGGGLPPPPTIHPPSRKSAVGAGALDDVKRHTKYGPSRRRRKKPPLCKGRWHGEAVTEGLCGTQKQNRKRFNERNCRRQSLSQTLRSDSSLYTREPLGAPYEKAFPRGKAFMRRDDPSRKAIREDNRPDPAAPVPA